jgi:hypothetical protein
MSRPSVEPDCMGVTATLLVHRIHGLPADRDIEHAEHLVSNREPSWV